MQGVFGTRSNWNSFDRPLQVVEDCGAWKKTKLPRGRYNLVGKNPKKVHQGSRKGEEERENKG